MGLFSKKTYYCSECGKQFEARFAQAVPMCKDCISKQVDQEMAEQAELDNLIREHMLGGYVKYRRHMGMEPLTLAQAKELVAHRDGILESVRIHEAITYDELRAAGERYKDLSNDEIIEILARVNNGTSSFIPGTLSIITANFMMPYNYAGMVIDNADVYTGVYNVDYRDGQKTSVAALFTNDPYVPVTYIVTSGESSLSDLAGRLFKGDKSNQDMVDVISSFCPNLTYTPAPVKDMLKALKGGLTIDGAVDNERMIRTIRELEAGEGLFKAKRLTEDHTMEQRDLMGRYGYLDMYETRRLLKMDDFGASRYWKKKLKELGITLEIYED